LKSVLTQNDLVKANYICVLNVNMYIGNSFVGFKAWLSLTEYFTNL
jgi:hypothetical protein